MLFVDGFASNDKMQRFKHHTEQQVYHTSKDLQQSPYTGKDSQQVGIVFILDGKTEYTNCMIQTVNDPSLSQKNITDSMISSFPSMHPPRICCHLFPTSVFCVLSSGESGIGPVSVFDKDLGRFDGEEVQDVWKRPQITSPLSSVHRGGDDHHDSTLGIGVGGHHTSSQTQAAKETPWIWHLPLWKEESSIRSRGNGLFVVNELIGNRISPAKTTFHSSPAPDARYARPSERERLALVAGRL